MGASQHQQVVGGTRPRRCGGSGEVRVHARRRRRVGHERPSRVAGSSRLRTRTGIGAPWTAHRHLHYGLRSHRPLSGLRGHRRGAGGPERDAGPIWHAGPTSPSPARHAGLRRLSDHRRFRDIGGPVAASHHSRRTGARRVGDAGHSADHRLGHPDRHRPQGRPVLRTARRFGTDVPDVPDPGRFRPHHHPQPASMAGDASLAWRTRDPLRRPLGSGEQPPVDPDRHPGSDVRRAVQGPRCPRVGCRGAATGNRDDARAASRSGHHVASLCRARHLRAR